MNEQQYITEALFQPIEAKLSRKAYRSFARLGSVGWWHDVKFLPASAKHITPKQLPLFFQERIDFSKCGGVFRQSARDGRPYYWFQHAQSKLYLKGS